MEYETRELYECFTSTYNLLLNGKISTNLLYDPAVFLTAVKPKEESVGRLFITSRLSTAVFPPGQEEMCDPRKIFQL